MPVEIYTAQIGKYRGKDALDITVKSGDRVFAPTWEMVWDYKKGKIAAAEYEAAYRPMMDLSYITHPARWQQVLSMPRVVLLCYCKPGVFCHRLLLADILSAMGGNYKGEKHA